MNQHLVRLDANALNRALIGFDTMFDALERRFANQSTNNYPPYNILKTGENQYEIQIAVTGFNKDEIAVEVEQNVLTVKGTSKVEEDPGLTYIYRGLASRDFTKEFPLAEHIEVKGAETKNGMLTIKLVRNIPESAKPRLIDIVEVK